MNHIIPALLIQIAFSPLGWWAGAAAAAMYYLGREMAQEIKAAFEAEGLDAHRYGMFCEDTLEDGSVRLGVRYDELLAFVVAAM